MIRAGLAVLLTLFVVCATGVAVAAPEVPVSVVVAPIPTWVEPAPNLVPGEVESSNGLSILLLDFQTRHVGAERWRFTRSAIRVTSEIGVQEAGQRKFSFVPPHERLILHELQLERGGQVIPHRDPEAIQLLRRETGLEYSVYDNERTALVVLPDLRVGDTIRCAYSIVGANPAHEGHVMESWMTGLPMAVGLLRQRLLTDHRLGARAFVGAPEPQRKELGGLIEYGFQGSNLAATRTDEAMPPDYQPLPWVQLSDFDSWSEVAAWGERLFRVRAPLSPRARAVVEEIRASAAQPEQQVRAVLRRVQDDIRYLALAFGDSTHRPAAPDLVLKRRFGDCKDKSLLAVTLLRALDLEAHVALVSTSSGRQLPELLPTGKVFDHAIVSVVVDGRRHWLDPTRLYQRGRLSDLAAREFHYALLLAPGQTGLVSVTEPEDLRPDMEARLRYGFPAFGDPVELTASVTYRRHRAEAIRALRASASQADFEQAAASTIREAYPQAVSDGEISVIDYEELNEIVVTRTYRLDGAWVTTPDGRLVLTLASPWLRGRLPVPGAERKHPLGLEHPLSIVVDVEIDPPEQIRTKDNSVVVTSNAFEFSYSARASQKAIHLHYSLSTRGPRVELAGLTEYRDALSKMQANLEYSLWKQAPITGSRWPPLGLSLLGGLWVLFLIGGIIAVQKYQPYLKRPNVAWEPWMAGRRGWLALLGLGVTIGPLFRLAELVRISGSYTELRWKQLTMAGSVDYDAWYAPALIFELLANLFYLLGSLYLAYLYWARQRSFPLVFSVVQVTALVLIWGDYAIVSKIEALAGRAQPTFQALVLIPIVFAWVAYVLNSRRVKATFLPDPTLPARRRRRRKSRRAKASGSVEPADEPLVE